MNFFRTHILKLITVRKLVAVFVATPPPHKKHIYKCFFYDIALCFLFLFGYIFTSVAYFWHFGTGPDPRIRASD